MSQENVTFTAEQFAKIIASISKAGNTYAKQIGNACLGALYFSIVQQDPAPANALVQAMRKSTKQQAVIDLLEDNGNLAWCKQGKKVPGFEFFDAMHTWLPEDVKELRTTCEQWEDYKKAPVVKDYDVQKAVEQIVKNVEAKTKKGQRVLHAELVKHLVDALAQHTFATYGEAV